MFKVNDKSNEQLAERGTNKLIVKLSKGLFKAAKITPKELTNKAPQAIIPSEKQEEEPMFEIY
jgi:hypothetical protein